ncbi:carboxypeptidase-like regulatory domain-containing protein [Flagellimonas sp.]|uniref:carboxypeptidase-like regulatory domain-containing protein n=1 Tax=Flagellimonas sp. TaxID=2058762 RepID=UPI003F49E4A2
MKRNKILCKTLLGTMVLGTLAVGCKNDLTEEDLINKNNELVEQQELDRADRAAEAINAAGELLSYSVKVVSANNEPVAGASVTLQAAAQTGEGGDPQTITTDANGEAFFGRAVIGGNILSVSADGFLDITARVDFGNISEGRHYQVIDGQVVPTPVTESSIVPLLSDGSGDQTATISGVVTIETDLTNSTPEVPQDLTLRASMPNFANQFNTQGSVDLEIYSFDSDLGIGTATVDNATGEYTMSVPATENGLEVELVAPNVSADQRLAIANRNGEPLDRPEYADIPTNFGPDHNYDGVPYIPGAIWTFPEPPAAGQGFDFTFERLGRGITTGLLFDMHDLLTPSELFGGGIDDMILHATSLGSGYTNSPNLTIVDLDGSGSGAFAEAHIEFAITGLTLTDAGSGFPAFTPIDFTLRYDEIEYEPNEEGELVPTETSQGVTELVEILTITTDDFGAITQDAVNEALQEAITNKVIGFDPENLRESPDWMSNLRLVSVVGPQDTDAVIVVNAAIGQVYQFRIIEAGNDYTNPSFVFSGGGASEQANINVLEFGTRWKMIPDNTGVTSPYTVLPSDMDYEYVPVSNDNDQSVLTSDDISDADFGNDSNVLNALEVDANGHIQFKNQIVEFFATDERSHIMPRAIIEEPRALKARVDIDFIGVDDNGGITTFDENVQEYGENYTEQFSVTVEPAAVGAPGTGALVDLTDGVFAENGEYR